MTYFNIYEFGVKAFQINHFKIQIQTQIQIQLFKCNLKLTFRLCLNLD